MKETLRLVRGRVICMWTDRLWSRQPGPTRESKCWMRCRRRSVLLVGISSRSARQSALNRGSRHSSAPCTPTTPTPQRTRSRVGWASGIAGHQGGLGIRVGWASGWAGHQGGLGIRARKHHDGYDEDNGRNTPCYEHWEGRWLI